MLTRRDFIRNAAAAIALPVYIPIERLDKIYIPPKKIIHSGNRLLTPPEIARHALDIFAREVLDVYTGDEKSGKAIFARHNAARIVGGDIVTVRWHHAPLTINL